VAPASSGSRKSLEPTATKRKEELGRGGRKARNKTRKSNRQKQRTRLKSRGEHYSPKRRDCHGYRTTKWIYQGRGHTLRGGAKKIAFYLRGEGKAYQRAAVREIENVGKEPLNGTDTNGPNFYEKIWGGREREQKPYSIPVRGKEHALVRRGYEEETRESLGKKNDEEEHPYLLTSRKGQA